MSGGSFGEQAEGFDAVGRLGHVEPLAAESRRQGLAVGLLVLDHQHPDALVRRIDHANSSASHVREAR